MNIINIGNKLKLRFKVKARHVLHQLKSFVKKKKPPKSIQVV